MEKNALRAMESGGRTSVAAAYEAMAAKEAGGREVTAVCLGLKDVEIHGIFNGI